MLETTSSSSSGETRDPRAKAFETVFGLPPDENPYTDTYRLFDLDKLRIVLENIQSTASLLPYKDLLIQKLKDEAEANGRSPFESFGYYQVTEIAKLIQEKGSQIGLTSEEVSHTVEEIKNKFLKQLEQQVIFLEDQIARVKKGETGHGIYMNEKDLAATEKQLQKLKEAIATRK